MNGISDVRINCIERMYNLISDNGAHGVALHVLRETTHSLDEKCFRTTDFLFQSEGLIRSLLLDT